MILNLLLISMAAQSKEGNLDRTFKCLTKEEVRMQSWKPRSLQELDDSVLGVFGKCSEARNRQHLAKGSDGNRCSVIASEGWREQATHDAAEMREDSIQAAGLAEFNARIASGKALDSATLHVFEKNATTATKSGHSRAHWRIEVTNCIDSTNKSGKLESSWEFERDKPANFSTKSFARDASFLETKKSGHWTIFFESPLYYDIDQTTFGFPLKFIIDWQREGTIRFKFTNKYCIQ